MTDTLQSPASREVPFTKCPSPKQNLTSDQKHNAQKRNPPPRDRVGQRTKQVGAVARNSPGLSDSRQLAVLVGFATRQPSASGSGTLSTSRRTSGSGTLLTNVRVRNTLDVSTNVRVRNTLDE